MVSCHGTSCECCFDDEMHFSHWITLLPCAATDAGLNFLDVVDFYINFILLIVGLLETFGAGWVHGIDEQLEKFGHGPVWAYMFSNFGAVLVACIIWFGTDADNQVWGGFVALFLVYFAGIGATVATLMPKVAETGESLGALMMDLAFGNVEHLRQELMEYTGYLPFIWAFMMKQLIPQVLFILFVNLCATEVEGGKPLFGNYGGYVNWPFQVLGILCVVFVIVLMLVGLIMPDMYEGFDLAVDKDREEADQAKQLDDDVEAAEANAEDKEEHA